MSSFEQVSRLDQLFVQQQFTPLVNKYRVATVGADGSSEGEPIAFVQQKRLRVREQVDIFSDEHRKDLVLRLKAKGVFEFRGRSEVQLPDGTVIGQLQKVFGKSLLRSTWEIRSADGESVVATAQEASLPLALLRRAWTLIPLLNNVPFFLPFHFDIAVDGRPVGRHRRVWSLLDRYVLDLTGDPDRRIDRRVALAFTIALDALQAR